MISMTIDSAVGARLRSERQLVEIRDDSGALIGHFIPAVAATRSENAEPKISEVELQRRERQGGGRPLADILTDLEKDNP